MLGGCTGDFFEQEEEEEEEDDASSESTFNIVHMASQQNLFLDNVSILSHKSGTVKVKTGYESVVPLLVSASATTKNKLC